MRLGVITRLVSPSARGIKVIFLLSGMVTFSGLVGNIGLERMYSTCRRLGVVRLAGSLPSSVCTGFRCVGVAEKKQPGSLGAGW